MISDGIAFFNIQQESFCVTNNINLSVVYLKKKMDYNKTTLKNIAGVVFLMAFKSTHNPLGPCGTVFMISHVWKIQLSWTEKIYFYFFYYISLSSTNLCLTDNFSDILITTNTEHI
jgi:hypothetical protein